MTALSRNFPLLYGPYTPPAVCRGDRVTCLMRDSDVIVTTWSDAPISWPLGYAPTEKPGGGPGFVVDEELVRALRCESSLAIQYWWRVGKTTVAKWRKALGVSKKNNDGTRLLVSAATAKARQAAREAGVSGEECRRRSQSARQRRLWEFSPDVTYGKQWTQEDIALLGTMSDPEVVGRTGHTLNAVRIRRRLLGIPRFQDAEPVGVSFERRTGRWYARISIRGTRIQLGTYDTREEAHRMYEEARRRALGPRQMEEG